MTSAKPARVQNGIRMATSSGRDRVATTSEIAKGSTSPSAFGTATLAIRSPPCLIVGLPIRAAANERFPRAPRLPRNTQWNDLVRLADGPPMRRTLAAWVAWLRGLSNFERFLLVATVFGACLHVSLFWLG